MTEADKPKRSVGRAEQLDFPELSFAGVPARIDTGAKTSALWTSQVTEEDGTLHVVFFGKESPHYTGKTISFDTYEPTIIASSNGHLQHRYKVRLLVKLKGKKVRAWFTLAERSTQVYPVLVGRNVLLGKFIVDVKKGRILKEEEDRRSAALRAELEKRMKEKK
jgi:hypothetical protein